MAVLPYLTVANNMTQIVSKINDVISFFDQRDSANEIKYTPFGTVTANNIQTAVQQVDSQATARTNAVTAALTANVITLNNSIQQVGNSSTDNAVALAIALG